jgi:hypothetical protein
MKASIVSILLFSFLLVGCNHSENQNTNDAASGVTKAAGENFDTFFKKFESDSTFQKSRITFPLKLLIIGGEGDNDSTKYISKASWKFESLSNSPQQKGILKKQFIDANEVHIQYQVENTGIQTERFFIKKNDGWRLSLVKDESD